VACYPDEFEELEAELNFINSRAFVKNYLPRRKWMLLHKLSVAELEDEKLFWEHMKVIMAYRFTKLF